MTLRLHRNATLERLYSSILERHQFLLSLLELKDIRAQNVLIYRLLLNFDCPEKVKKLGGGGVGVGLSPSSF